VKSCCTSCARNTEQLECFRTNSILFIYQRVGREQVMQYQVTTVTSREATPSGGQKLPQQCSRKGGHQLPLVQKLYKCC
jgi:hypothetical protein